MESLLNFLFWYPSFPAAKWKSNRIWLRCKMRSGTAWHTWFFFWAGNNCTSSEREDVWQSPCFSLLPYPGIGRLAIRPRELFLLTLISSKNNLDVYYFLGVVLGLNFILGFTYWRYFRLQLLVWCGLGVFGYGLYLWASSRHICFLVWA